MAIPITPSLGVDFSRIYASNEKLPLRVGSVVEGSDGHKYVLATASGAVANNTAVVLTEPAMTFAAGAGAWTTVAGAVTSGQSCWIQKTAI